MKLQNVSHTPAFGMNLGRNLTESVRAGFSRELLDLYPHKDVLQIREMLAKKLTSAQRWLPGKFEMDLLNTNGGYTSRLIVRDTFGETVSLTDDFDSNSVTSFISAIGDITKERLGKIADYVSGAMAA